MRPILVLVLVAGVAWIGGSYALHGRLPWVAVSDEEQQLQTLRESLDRIRAQWRAAGRAGALGLDASSQAEGPLMALEQLEKDLAALEPRLKRGPDKVQAAKLRREVAMFRSEMR